MYHSSKSRNFLFDLFYLVAWDVLDLHIVSKHRKWYLQMSRTLSMPIRWLCLRLTKTFARRCHQARKVEHFDFDLTCDVTGDPEVIKICFPSTVFPGLSNADWIFRIGPVVSEIRGGGARNSPPPSGARFKNIPVGRGLVKVQQYYFCCNNTIFDDTRCALSSIRGIRM